MDRTRLTGALIIVGAVIQLGVLLFGVARKS